MSPAEFFRAVWPATGFYVLATPFIIPNTQITSYVHRTFETIDQAVAHVEARSEERRVGKECRL